MSRWGTLDWGDWLYGLFYAVISGGATAVYAAFSTMLVAPDQFNLQHPQKLFLIMSTMFGLSGFMSGMGFLRTQALPKILTLQRTETPGKVVTTVQETLPQKD